MYLSGSKWNLRKKRRRSNPWRVLLLLLLIAGAVYIERVVVPTVPPPFIPTPIPTRSPASYLLEARSLFEAGKLTQAQESYENAIKTGPEEATFYIELARLLVLTGDYEGAETNARNALLISPTSALAHAVLGWALDFQGELVDAQREIERALELDPNSALAYAYYAEILIDVSQVNYEKALEQARKAVELDPNLMESHRAMGYVWEWTGNHELAIDSYKTALLISPNLPMLYFSLGNMYLAVGQVDLAIENYLNSTALAPNDVRPFQLLARANAQIGEYGQASQYAAEAVDRDPSNPYMHGDLGRMLYKNNQLADAVIELGLAIHGGQLESGELVQGLSIDPQDSRVIEFYYMYGLALAKTGTCLPAREIAETLLLGVRDDEFAVANAEEILNLCSLVGPAPTSETTATPAP